MIGGEKVEISELEADEEDWVDCFQEEFKSTSNEKRITRKKKFGEIQRDGKKRIFNKILQLLNQEGYNGLDNVSKILPCVTNSLQIKLNGQVRKKIKKN